VIARCIRELFKELCSVIKISNLKSKRPPGVICLRVF
jgi:hypothetical protein